MAESACRMGREHQPVDGCIPGCGVLFLGASLFFEYFLFLVVRYIGQFESVVLLGVKSFEPETEYKGKHSKRREAASGWCSHTSSGR